MATASSKSVKESRMEAPARTWTAKPILGREYTDDPPLEDVFVGLLKHKKDIAVAIRSVSTILPGFNHLKRCSADRLLLAPLNSVDLIAEARGSTENAEPLTQEELKVLLKKKEFDLDILEPDFQVMKVSAKPSRTKAQAFQAKKLWPVNFHPDPFVESMLNGSIFSDDQLRLIENNMRLAIEAATLEAVGTTSCNGSVVIVDPKDGKVLAMAASRTDQHPLWHAAMLAIDLVARLQGGGAWPLDKDPEAEPEAKPKAEPEAVLSRCQTDSTMEANRDLPVKDTVEITKDTREESQKDTQDEDTSETACSPKDNDENFERKVQALKRKYNEDAPLCYPKSLKQIQLPVEEPLETKTTRKGRRNNGATRESENERPPEKCGPYLCTGYWVFSLMEPCPMCAMGLLHSRVARIFYGVPNESVGILGSKEVLHALPGLNHRYLVWSGVLEQECREALKEIERKNTHTNR